MIDFAPESVAYDKLSRSHADLLAALKETRDWLESFSVPPTSTIKEKEEALALIVAAISRAEKAVR